MIPYFEIPLFHLGPLKFSAFGILVMLGFWVGALLAARRAEKVGLPVLPIYDVALLCIIFGFIGAHLFEMLAYEPREVLKNPWILLKFWAGISSFGGLLGASLACVVYFKKKNLPSLAYADALLFGLIPGWLFLGRLGCFTAHDHPGIKTAFFLGVKFPGGVRHDLGLYEFMLSWVLIPWMFWMARSPRPAGWFLARLLIIYGAVRFGLDFLRARDISDAEPRYGGLTPGQYVAILFVLFGLYLFDRVKKGKNGTWKQLNPVSRTA